MSDDIRTKPTTDAYRDGWDRTVGGRAGDLLVEVLADDGKGGIVLPLRFAHLAQRLLGERNE